MKKVIELYGNFYLKQGRSFVEVDMNGRKTTIDNVTIPSSDLKLHLQRKRYVFGRDWRREANLDLDEDYNILALIGKNERPEVFDGKTMITQLAEFVHSI